MPEDARAVNGEGGTTDAADDEYPHAKHRQESDRRFLTVEYPAAGQHVPERGEAGEHALDVAELLAVGLVSSDAVGELGLESLPDDDGL